MKITFLNIESNKKVYREYNGGFGTSFNAGRSFLGKMLTWLRTSRENFPLMSYAYAATILNNHGHNVSIETNTIPDSDIVIIHASMPNHSLEKEYIHRLINKGIKVGIIGPFASAMPDLFNEATFTVSGEPENAIIRLAQGIIPRGLAFSEPVNNLDELPFPDWHMFPIDDFSYDPIITKKPFTFVLSSRGCSYGCNYCPYIAKPAGRTFRARSTKNVINELKYLAAEFGVKGVQFRDPIFTIDKKRISELCTAIINEGLNIEMGCETRLDRLDKDLLNLMHKAGFRIIKVGIESSNNDVLRKSKRIPIEVMYQEEIIRHCNKIGIKIVAFYVIGLENDTHETISETLRYSKRLNTDFANFTICTPIPGTEFYETIKDKIFTNNYDLYDDFNPTFHHQNLSSEDLVRYQEKAIVSYYLRPRYIYKYLRNNFVR